MCHRPAGNSGGLFILQIRSALGIAGNVTAERLTLYSVADIDKHKSNQDIGTSDATENADDKNEGDPKGHPGSELAGQSHGDLAADAAAYLERCGNSLEGFGGDSQEIDRQAARLIDWARENNLLLTEQYTATLFKHLSTTAEHQVFYRA